MIPPRRFAPRARRGLSLVELLFAISMISILVVTAYLNLQDNIEEARMVSSLNRLDQMRKALEAWAADHQEPYPTTDIEPLLGRYLPGREDDGWGNDFVVDPFFMRLISRGKNARLDTQVPGSPELWFPPEQAMNHESDDLVAAVGHVGRLFMTVPGQGVFQFAGDGSDLTQVAASPAADVDQAPGGGVVVWSIGTDLIRDWMNETGGLGESRQVTVGTSQTLYEAVPAESLTANFNGPGGASYGSVCMAPDGYHLAALQENTAGNVHLLVGEVLSQSEDQGARAQVVTTFAPGSDLLAPLRWDRNSSKLVTLDTSGNVVQLFTSPGAKPIIPYWGDTNAPASNVAATSVDLCVTRDRMVINRGGATEIRNGLTGGLVPLNGQQPAPTTAGVNPRQISAGGDTLATWNRRGDAVAIVGSGGQLWLWWPDRADGPGNPFLLHPNLDTLLGGLPSQIKWR